MLKQMVKGGFIMLQLLSYFPYKCLVLISKSPIWHFWFCYNFDEYGRCEPCRIIRNFPAPSFV